MSRIILFVDDEPKVLRSLKRLFMETEYSILTAENGHEAIAFLEKEPVDMIISDMRMPEMDGYDLLLHVKRHYPQVLRLLLSGYSDENVVMKALQENVARLYLFKPWKNEELLVTIDQLFHT